MRAKGKKSLKIILIIVAILILLAGIFIGMFFALKNREIRYYNIALSDQTATLTFSNEKMSLEPNSVIINRPVLVNVSKESSSAFIRAKITFESNSEDNRVLSFVNQLNYAIKDTVTFAENSYSWKYIEADNSFYLVTADENLRIVTNKDDNYYFIKELKVPSSLDQVSSTNSDGNNVQIGEDIKVKITFEAIQTIDILGNKTPTIGNVKEHFNNFATYSENGFISQNGYIIAYTGNKENLVLPKYVGEDYILGVKENAFVGSTLKKVIVPGSYISFADNAFSGCTGLNYVALKSETPIKLTSSSFPANTSLEIYLPNASFNYVKQNFTTLAYLNNLKNYTVVGSAKTSEIDTDVEAIYAPYVTEFEGDFKNHTKLKLLIAPLLSKINDNMFQGNTALIECDTPNVLTVGSFAFDGCVNLIDAKFSKKLASIGEKSFIGCSNLLNINFAQNLSLIPTEAFRNCAQITHVKFLKENLVINSGAFYNCTNLRMLDIQNLSSIENLALGNNNNLRYVKVNTLNSNFNINENCVSNSNNALFVFVNETSKSSFTTNLISLSNKTVLIKINNKVLEKFEGNVKNLNLTEFSLITEFDEIKDDAFKNNQNLNSLTISSNIKKIGDNFISGCTNLTTLIINSSRVPKFSENAFEGVNENLVIYVPNSSLKLYQKTLEKYNITILSIN